MLYSPGKISTKIVIKRVAVEYTTRQLSPAVSVLPHSYNYSYNILVYYYNTLPYNTIIIVPIRVHTYTRVVHLVYSNTFSSYILHAMAYNLYIYTHRYYMTYVVYGILRERAAIIGNLVNELLRGTVHRGGIIYYIV